MSDSTYLKFGLVALIDIGIVVLVGLGKLEWANAKDVITWTVTPFLVGHSLETAAESLAARKP